MLSYHRPGGGGGGGGGLALKCQKWGSCAGADPGFFKRGVYKQRKGGGGTGGGPILGPMLKAYIVGQKGGPDPLTPPPPRSAHTVPSF